MLDAWKHGIRDGALEFRAFYRHGVNEQLRMRHRLETGMRNRAARSSDRILYFSGRAAYQTWHVFRRYVEITGNLVAPLPRSISIIIDPKSQTTPARK